jgi:exopolysaccharide biosynthesis protein
MKCKKFVYDLKYVNLFLICLICLLLINGVFTKKKNDVISKHDNKNTNKTKQKLNNKLETDKSSVQSIYTFASDNKKNIHKSSNQKVDSKSNNNKITKPGTIDSKTFNYLSAFDRKSSMYNRDSKKLNSLVRKKYYR